MENHSNEEQSCNIEKHPKQDFQVERLAFFSDAVFAIALTLLIIEFKVPRITGDTTFDDVLKQVLDLKYLFIATLFSFLLIASHWINHHHLFKYIHNYNTKLIIINMLVLFPVIFFPFTTAFLAESFNSLLDNLFENGKPSLNIFFLGFRLFALNHLFASIMYYILYWYAMVKHKELSYPMPAKEKNDFIINSGFMIFTFAAAFVATFFTNILILDLILWGGIIIWVIIKRKFKNKLAENK